MLRIACFATLTLAALATSALAQKPIAIAEIKRDTTVDFEKEVLPILKKHCVACHNSAAKEGNLILETPQSILKGGDSGPAVEAKKSAASLLLQVASHQSEPYMPPPDNKVNAKPLSPQELGILKLWIDQGATGTVSASGADVKWQPLPAGVHPIYAVDITPDGQFVACGRANQVFIYNVASGQVVCRLTDPQLLKQGVYSQPGVAHLDIVQSLAFSPDGYLLASGGFQEVKLWRRPRNVQTAKMAGPAEATTLAASADGKLLAVAGADNTIKLWELATGKHLKDLTGHSAAINALRFSADGARLFSGSADKTLHVWNTADGKSIAQIETPAVVHALTLVGDGTVIATGGADNIIRLWKLAGEPLALAAQKEIKGHTGPVTALDTVPSANTQIVSGSADGSVRHWNTDNGNSMRQMAHGGPVASVAVSADGKRFASAGGNYARLWNGAEGKQLAEMKGDLRAQHAAALAAKVNEKAKQVIAAHKTELANAEKDIKPKTEVEKKAKDALAAAEKTFKEKEDASKKAMDAKVAAEKASTDAAAEVKSATEAVAKAKEELAKDKENKDLAEKVKAAEKGLADANAKAKKTADDAKAAVKPVTDAEKPLAEAKSTLNSAKRNADDAVSALKKAQDLVPATKKLIETAEAAQKQTEAALDVANKASKASELPVKSVAFSPDNLQLATGGDDKFVHTWSANDGSPLEIYEGHSAPVVALAFASAGGVVSASADKTAIAWDTRPEWTLERAIGGIGSGAFVDRVISLDFSPDGKLLATGGGEPSRSGEVKIWNVADGSLVKELVDAHSDTVFSLDFSPDGKLLASSAADKFVKVHDVASGKFIRSFEGHTHHVLGVSWQAGGKMLASGGADNVIKVWNYETGEQQRTIQGFGKQVSSLAFVGDTINTLTASGDKTVRLHRADNGQNIRSFAGGTDFMNSAAATPNGKLVVGGGQDGVLWIWNGDNGQKIQNLAPPESESDKQASK